MIPTSGPISIDQVNAELGRAAGAALSMDDVALRLLTRNLSLCVGSVPISMNDIRGGSGFAMRCYMGYQGDGSIIGARQGDGVNSYPLGYVKDGLPVSEISSGFTDSYTGVVYTTIEFNAAVAAPDFYDHFWMLGIWNDSLSSFLGTIKGSDENYSIANLDRHSIAAPVGTWLDLRPYVGQWLRFVFFGH